MTPLVYLKLLLIAGLLQSHKYALASGTEGQFRLVGGATANQGRIEVFHDGEWGTVCDDDFGQDDADMICRSLGYADGAAATQCCSVYGAGTDPVHLNGMDCPSDADELADCSNWAWGESTRFCWHVDDAGVICDTGNALPAEEGTFRLVGFTLDGRDGRVEVMQHGVWGTVCGNRFSSDDADMICKSLGFLNGAATIACCGAYGQGDGPIHFGDLNCPAGSDDLGDCSPVNWEALFFGCWHRLDPGVICVPDTEVTADGQFLLFSGSNSDEGIVFVSYAGILGTVCDTGFGNNEANLICRLKGYGGANSIVRGSDFEVVDAGPIFLGNLNCPPDAVSLDDCSGWKWSGVYCDHTQDVGLVCGEGLLEDEAPARRPWWWLWHRSG